MKKTFLILTVLIWIGSLASVFAAGKTSGNFLKIGVGGRPVGMGEAYTALANDASAAYWNPAGLGEQEALEIFSMHSNWLVDTSFQYLGFAFPFRDMGALGLSYRVLNYGNIPAYNASGSREADVYASDSALCFSWGRALNEKLSLGLNLKYVSQSLASFNAGTASLDLGMRFNLQPSLVLGVSVQNILGSLTFIQDEGVLPRKLSVGLGASHFIFEPLTVAVDYNMPLDGSGYLNYGCEYLLNDFFALRLGSAQSRWQGGIGFKTPSFGLDYAYVPYQDLGATHRVSFSFCFGIRKQDEIRKHYQLGKDYYRQQKYLDALAEFKKVLDLNPLHRDSREFVDRIIEEMRQKTLFEKVKALREEKKKSRELLEQAVLEFQKRNYAKTQELVEQSLKYAPNNKKALELKERLDKVLKIKK